MKTLLALMIQRDLKPRAVAEMIGENISTFQSALSRNRLSGQTQAKVERALGFVPIWSDSREVEARRQCVERLGFDPAAMVRDDLRERIKTLPAEARLGESYAEMVDGILQFVIANPKFTLPPS